MTQEEMEQATWEVSTNKCVWLCKETGKFHFVCETEMLDEEPYNTLEACEQALTAYARSL